MLKFKEPKTIILMNKAFVNFFLHDTIRNGEGRPKDLFAAPLSLRLCPSTQVPKSPTLSDIVSAFVSLDCSQCQTPGLTNAQAGPLPASGVPRPDIPPTAHLHQPPTSNSPPWEGLSSETFGWEPILGNGEITEKLNL